MSFPYYRQALLAEDFDAYRVLDEYFHCGQSRVFVGSPPGTEAAIKQSIARSLQNSLGVQVHSLQLVVCGSAHLGFSPVPQKLGKPFDPISSDMDIAVVSEQMFDQWWSELIGCRMTRDERIKTSEQLFWGLIDPSTAARFSEIGKVWWKVFAQMTPGVLSGPPLANGIRGRLYRNFWSMENYHIRAIEKGREVLLGSRS